MGVVLRFVCSLLKTATTLAGGSVDDEAVRRSTGRCLDGWLRSVGLLGRVSSVDVFVVPGAKKEIPYSWVIRCIYARWATGLIY